MSGTDDAYEDAALVAEYVLHLLDADARAVFEVRLQTDRALQDMVYRWEEDLAALADEIAPVTPPSALRQRVLKAVAPVGKRSILAASWSRLVGGALVAGVLAALLIGAVFQTPTDLSPEFQAELATDDGSLIVLAGVIPATHEIVIERVSGGPRPGRVHELWLIAEGADGPVSLGVLENQGPTRIRVPDAIAPGVRTGTIAISDEPPGGSPTGAPTGDILATATFVDL